MDPDRFAQVKGLVLRVADLPPDERRIILDQACRDDPELRREIVSILGYEDIAVDVLNSRAVLDRELQLTAPTMPVPEAARIGQTIGCYHITGFRGEGGMGEVYRAEDTRLRRSVALKFVRPDLVSNESLKDRFVEEARAAAALEHPNVCTVHAIEEWEGQLFLVMAFIEGETLKDRIARGPLDVPEILSIAAQAATGLEAAHSRGIVHRDIKSANIMLTNDDRAVIVDFGLARSRADSAASESEGESEASGADRPRANAGTRVMGTVAYMSPEQSRGEPMDRRSDIWSLGVVLYEMVTGRLPFDGKTALETIQAVRTGHPRPCRALRPDTPAELDRIVCRCLAKRADERYGDSAELLSDLQALRRRIDPVLRAQQRRARLALVVPAIVVALLAVLMVRGIVLRRENPPLPRAQPLQVTSGDSWEGEPALSPDGSRIAYTSDETGERQIYLIDVRGGNPVRLTRGGGWSDHPAWFPDGRDLAFVSSARVGWGIFRIPALGEGASGAKLIVPHGTDPAISPDGERIAFVRPGSTMNLRIWVATLAQPGDSTMLTHDGDGTWDHADPAWSPDGAFLCYSASRGMWIVPSGGGPARQLTRDEPDQEPDWSHDGRSIYFSSYRGGTLAVWRIGITGRHAQRLTNGTGPESHPDVSGEGMTLAYTTGMTGREMFVLDRQTARQTRVPGVRNSMMAGIAPDGSMLVYQAERRGGRTDLWIQPMLDGHPSGDPGLLTDQPGVPSHPIFSFDGRWVAYYLIGNEGRDIWVAPVPPSSNASTAGTQHAWEGMFPGEPNRITLDPGKQNEQPAWSPDGKALAYVKESGGHTRLAVIPIGEGRPVGQPAEITKGEPDAFHPVWLPDGKTIAFVGVKDEEQEVWVVRADGSKPPYRITARATANVVRWDPAGGRLLVSGMWGGSVMEIRSVSLDTGDTAPLSPAVDFGSARSPGMFDISADGRWIVYPHEEDKGDVWVEEASNGRY